MRVAVDTSTGAMNGVGVQNEGSGDDFAAEVMTLANMRMSCDETDNLPEMLFWKHLETELADTKASSMWYAVFSSALTLNVAIVERCVQAVPAHMGTLVLQSQRMAGIAYSSGQCDVATGVRHAAWSQHR